MLSLKSATFLPSPKVNAHADQCTVAYVDTMCVDGTASQMCLNLRGRRCVEVEVEVPNACCALRCIAVMARSAVGCHGYFCPTDSAR